MTSIRSQAGIDLPPLDGELVKVLDQRFPDRCPAPHQSDREIWMAAGQRSVIRYLQDQLERQRRLSSSSSPVDIHIEMGMIKPGAHRQ